MAGEITTWAKTKDALLVGAAGLCVLVALKILADVTDIRTQLAAYQSDARAQKETTDRLQRELAEVRRELTHLQISTGTRR